jgi:hypothetical protein
VNLCCRGSVRFQIDGVDNVWTYLYNRELQFTDSCDMFVDLGIYFKVSKHFKMDHKAGERRQIEGYIGEELLREHLIHRNDQYQLLKRDFPKKIHVFQ